MRRGKEKEGERKPELSVRRLRVDRIGVQDHFFHRVSAWNIQARQTRYPQDLSQLLTDLPKYMALRKQIF